MATVKKYLDYAGLQAYNTAIQTWANSVSQLGYKTILKSSDGNKIYFFTKPNATLSDVVTEGTGATPYVELGSADAAAKISSMASVVGAAWDATANSGAGAYVITGNGGISGFANGVDTAVKALNELRSELTTVKGSDSTPGSFAKAIKDAIEALDVSEFALASVSSNVVTIKGIKEVDGKIAVGDGAGISLEEVAYTGAAADVSIADEGSNFTSSTVEGALAELATSSASGSASKTIYMTDDTTTSGTDYAKIYKLYQGSTGSSASPTAGELIGTINIPKDQFVELAALVDITFDSENTKLKDGSTDVTSNIVGESTPTSANAGKYIKLVFAITSGSAAKSTVYIAVKELVDVYTGGSTTEATVSVNASTNVITVDINVIAASKIIYKAAAGTDPAETVEDALNNIGSIPLEGTNSIASLFA